MASKLDNQIQETEAALFRNMEAQQNLALSAQMLQQSLQALRQRKAAGGTKKAAVAAKGA